MLPGNRTLKSKRSVVRKLLDRVRARFHVSAAEVAEQESHQRVVLGFCTCGADGRKIEQVMSKLLDFVEASGEGQVVSTETEIVDYEDLAGELEVESYADKFGLGDEAFETDSDVPVEAEVKGGKARIRPGSLGFGSRDEED